MKSGGYYTLYDISLIILNLLSIYITLGTKGVESFLSNEKNLKFEKEIGLRKAITQWTEAEIAINKHGIAYIDSGTSPTFSREVADSLSSRTNKPVKYLCKSPNHKKEGVHVYIVDDGRSNRKFKFLLEATS